jgi:hypothetical protein
MYTEINYFPCNFLNVHHRESTSNGFDKIFHVKWIPCHSRSARPTVTEGVNNAQI